MLASAFAPEDEQKKEESKSRLRVSSKLGNCEVSRISHYTFKSREQIDLISAQARITIRDSSGSFPLEANILIFSAFVPVIIAVASALQNAYRSVATRLQRKTNDNHAIKHPTPVHIRARELGRIR